MSTYRDQYTHIQENIAVDYNTRITIQPVKLLSEQNEYWGRFHGKISADDIIMTNGSLSGTKLYDVQLCGNTVIPGIGVLSDYQQTVIDISTGLTSEIEQRQSDVNRLTTRLDNISSEIDMSVISNALSNALVSTIYNVATNVCAELCCVSILLSNEISSVKINYAVADKELSNSISSLSNMLCTDIVNLSVMLSGDIDQVRRELTAESATRYSIDEKLSSSISAIDIKDDNHFSLLCVDLSAHKLENEQQFVDTKSELLSAIDNKKHFEIYGEAEGLFNSYPYKLKEFAVNVIYTSLNTAFLLDTDNNNVKVGSVSKKPAYTIVKFYDLENSPKLKKAILPNQSFTFTQPYEQQINGNYYVTYDEANNRVLITPISTKQYYRLLSGEQQIGRITDVKFDDTEKIISGLITVNTSIDQLSIFNEFQNAEITRTTPANVGTEQIRLASADYASFEFRKYVYDQNYCPICAYFSTLSEVKEVAKILSGNVIYDEFGILSSIKVSYNNELVDLNRNNSFEKACSENLRLSCNTTERKFALDYISAYYKYNIYSNTDVGLTGQPYGFVVPGKANTALSAYDYNTLSVILSTSDITDVRFNGTYVLTKLSEVSYNFWRGESDLSGKGHMTIEFDTQVVKFFGTIYGSTEFIGTYPVKVNDPLPEIYQTATVIRNLWTSTITNWTYFPSIVEAEAAKYTITYNGPISPSVEDSFTLAINSSGIDKIQLQVPDKAYAGNSRELMMCFNISSDLTNNIQIDLLDASGNQIDFYNNKKKELYIKPNTWTTYQLNEVRQSKFLLVDLNETEQNDQIKQLSTLLSSEIENLSTLLSSDLRTVSVDLHNLSNNLCIDISNLSTWLSNDVKDFKQHVSENYIHISGDSNIGRLELSNSLVAKALNSNTANILSISTNQLSAKFSNIFDITSSGSLSTLSNLVDPTFLNICYRINEIISYANLGLDLLLVNSELINNILIRTNEICDKAGISRITDPNPTFGQIVDKLNESLNYLEFKNTGTTLKTQLDIIRLGISNNISAINYIATHYNDTFTQNKLTTGNDISVDVLLLTDEIAKTDGSYNKYYLTVEAGTLVMKPFRK